MADGIGRGASSQDRIPALLRDLPRWLRWRIEQNAQGRPTKVPDCSTRDRTRWREFGVVDSAGPIGSEHGIGFVMTGGVDVEGGRLYAIDIDGCRDPVTGTIEYWADAILNTHARSYTEVTPSGCGLRQWFIVRDFPKALRRSKAKVPAAAAPNVPSYKAVEVQLFGLGPAQYVTVSGNHLLGTSAEILVVPNLRWLIDTYQLQEAGRSAPVSLPSGTGTPPSLAQVRALLLQASDGPAIIDGDWKAILGSQRKDRDYSASAAFWRVCRKVLAAAGGHGPVALQFLLRETAWGRGEIEDSKDPLRYTRSEWVVVELARVASKQAVASPGAGVFDDGFDPEAWSTAHPPAAAVLEAPVDAAKGPRPRWIDGDDLAKQDGDDVFLVYGVLSRFGLAEIFGDPGTGKTPYALSLAVHVSSGMPTWFGHEIDFHGPVAYLVGEDLAGIRNRYKAERALHGIADGHPIRFSLEPGRLCNADDVARIYTELREWAPKGLALLVVDTLAANFGEGDENATQDMNIFARNCHALARLLKCLVLLVHHTGHGSKERARGSMVLFGALDASFRIEREGKLSLSATPTKARNWADPDPLQGTLAVTVVSTDRKGRPITAVALRTEKASAVEAMAGLSADDPLRRLIDTVVELKGEAITKVALAARLGCSRNRHLDQLVDRAVDLGLIRADKGGKGGAAGGGKTSYRLTESVKSDAPFLGRIAFSRGGQELLD